MLNKSHKHLHYQLLLKKKKKKKTCRIVALFNFSQKPSNGSPFRGSSFEVVLFRRFMLNSLKNPDKKT